jgi:hypothetical protein
MRPAAAIAPNPVVRIANLVDAPALMGAISRARAVDRGLLCST